MAGSQGGQAIPTQLGLAQFEQFVLPHRSVGSRGPAPKLSLFKIFNYILRHLYMGCQWKELPIERDGDGTMTAAKKGGDNIGFSGHKKVKGDKVVAFCDRWCKLIAPFVSAPGNHNESPLLREALPEVMRIARTAGIDLQDSVVSLDGVYDCRSNRKAIFNRGMVPNINPNPRGRKGAKRGRKPLFEPAIFDERFHTIERVFAWEDKFRLLLLRLDRLSRLHYAFKTLAYTMINLRHYCRA
jgi:transposase